MTGRHGACLESGQLESAPLSMTILPGSGQFSDAQKNLLHSAAEDGEVEAVTALPGEEHEIRHQAGRDGNTRLSPTTGPRLRELFQKARWPFSLPSVVKRNSPSAESGMPGRRAFGHTSLQRDAGRCCCC